LVFAWRVKTALSECLLFDFLTTTERDRDRKRYKKTQSHSHRCLTAEQAASGQRLSKQLREKTFNNFTGLLKNGRKTKEKRKKNRMMFQAVPDKHPLDLCGLL